MTKENSRDSRKNVKPEDVVEAGWRRRWFIVGPFMLIAVASVVVAALLPDRYRSEALLQIVRPAGASGLCPIRGQRATRCPPAGDPAADSDHARTRRIVQEFNLYPEERKRMLMEDVIERMRTQHVLIGGLCPDGRINSSAFRVVRSEQSENRHAYRGAARQPVHQCQSSGSVGVRGPDGSIPSEPACGHAAAAERAKRNSRSSGGSTPDGCQASTQNSQQALSS